VAIVMEKTLVAVIKGKNPKEMVRKALILIKYEKLVKPEDKVLIKPNYVAAKHPDTGITTDSRIVEGIIELVKELGVEEITVGEGGAWDTDKAFDVVGIRNVVARQKVRLVNLNTDERCTIKIPRAKFLKEVGIAKTVLECTSIINVPKLKVHHMALVTLSMKNLMGFILPKNIMHEHINQKIVELASIFVDKVKINLVDGFVGSEVDEVDGKPVKMDVVVAGRDMVATDTVSAAIMGIPPEKVRYLKIAEEQGLGTASFKNITVVGEKIEDVKKGFQLPPQFQEYQN
jgi:uncharacterized protein (DUF362 family)